MERVMANKLTDMSKIRKAIKFHCGGKSKLFISQYLSLCDWDYDGLKIFDLVKAKVPQIGLLLPTANPVSIIKSEHNSH